MLISLVFYIVSQKNKQRHFRTFFIPGPKDKMATNGKINTNPSGSSHGEQLVAKRLTLVPSQEDAECPMSSDKLTMELHLSHAFQTATAQDYET